MILLLLMCQYVTLNAQVGIGTFLIGIVNSSPIFYSGLCARAHTPGALQYFEDFDLVYIESIFFSFRAPKLVPRL